MSEKSKAASKKASSKEKKSSSPQPKKEDKKEDKKTDKKNDSKQKKPDTSINTKRSNNESRIENKEDNTTNKDKFNDSNLLEIINTKKTNKPTNNNNKYIEKCEGCFDNEGTCFCVVCEKIYCKMCENQIHMVPSNMNHERLPITEIHHLKKLCYHHNQPLKFYCESCEEPICLECHHIGPHNNKLHKISNVIDSFRKKFNYINNIIQNNLLEKYDVLITQLQTIDFHTEQIKLAKNEIERGIRAEYTKLIEDLRSEEGKKLAMMQSESSILQKDLNRINDVISFVKDINNSETPDMVAFLLRFRKINETVELCLAKQIKSSLELNDRKYRYKSG